MKPLSGFLRIKKHKLIHKVVSPQKTVSNSSSLCRSLLGGLFGLLGLSLGHDLSSLFCGCNSYSLDSINLFHRCSLLCSDPFSFSFLSNNSSCFFLFSDPGSFSSLSLDSGFLLLGCDSGSFGFLGLDSGFLLLGCNPDSFRSL